MIKLALVDPPVYFIPGAFVADELSYRAIKKIKKALSELKKVSVIFVRGHMPLPGSAGWKLLLKKTGAKYIDRDQINKEEISFDWIKYFSRRGSGAPKKQQRSLSPKTRYENHQDQL